MKVPSTNVIPNLLLRLGIPAHRVGFKYLCIAIADFTKDNPPFLTKELYPHIAKMTGAADWRSVEISIRDVIHDGWSNGDRSAWLSYFPGSRRKPTSKQFIATIAEYLDE